MSELEFHLPHKYCPKCGLWRDMDGLRCERCGTALVPRQLNEQDQDITYGDLGDHAAAWHDESWGHDQIAIRAKGEVRIDLNPRQFLVLLDWGMNHRKAVERLAKEQEGG
jgi:hypothetical protein